jgi:anti-anti-sigma factor
LAGEGGLEERGGVGEDGVATARLSFIDSAGLQTLLIASSEANAAGVRLRIVERSPAVDRILTMTDAGAALSDG